MARAPESLVEIDGYKVLGAIEQTVLEPADKILVAGQMRAAIDEYSQKELEESLRKHGQDLPLVTSLISLGLAREYVHYTNNCWDARVTIPKRVIRPSNEVALLTAGHRRYKGNINIAKNAGISTSELAIKAFRREPKSVMEIMKMQARENLHSRPPAIQFARITQEMYSVGRQLGEYKSIADFLPDSPLKEDATRCALLFFTLPKEVQKFVSMGDMSYTMGLEVAFYQHTLEEYNLRNFIDSIGDTVLDDKLLDQMKLLAEAVTHDEIKTFAMTIIGKMRPRIEGSGPNIKKTKGWSSGTAIKHIRGKAADLRTTQEMQLEYFNGAIERATYQHKQSRLAREKVLGDAAVEAVYAARHLINAGVDVPAETKKAATLIAKKHGVNLSFDSGSTVDMGSQQLFEEHPEQTLSMIA